MFASSLPRRRLAVSVRTALVGALLISASVHAADADVADDQKKAQENATTLSGVQVSADMAAPTAAYAGGQVARGGRFGVLGNQDAMNVPFALTSLSLIHI